MFLVFASLAVAVAGGIALIASELRNAPEGFEDANGFHAVGGAKSSKRRRGSQARRFVSDHTAGIDTRHLAAH
jgi:hypothetical protein